MLLRRQATEERDEHIDMTPMVDVVFQLMTRVNEAADVRLGHGFPRGKKAWLFETSEQSGHGLGEAMAEADSTQASKQKWRRPEFEVEMTKSTRRGPSPDGS